MTPGSSAPWHKASFDNFINDTLPRLLSERLPISGYHAESIDTYTCRLQVAIQSSTSDINLTFNLPQLDEAGLFQINNAPHLIVPIASSEYLDTADVTCVGEQLFDYIEDHLGEAPSGLPWDETIARTWLPLEAWITEFMDQNTQRLDDTNWLSAKTHLRRIYIPERTEFITSGQFGLVCPFEVPEGPNLGRVFSVAVGAEIRDRKLVNIDNCPEASLGLTASMVPFLEHNDPNRALMGVNMMRQAIAPTTPEPAYVQTGNEPDIPGFWYGLNLLTAFISWGTDTYEDAIIISESAAKKMEPFEVGERLTNRHGSKGIVSKTLPDEEMPRLHDGTPVELIFSFLGVHTRLNHGQIMEAVMSRIARAEGQPAMVPPFHAPEEPEIRKRLINTGLPENGMEYLIDGKTGEKLEQPSLVGWIYWNKSPFGARNAISYSTEACMRQGEFEFFALRDAGAYENLLEQFNTRSADRSDSASLAERLAEGPVGQAPPPTPKFVEVAEKLAKAGIEARLEDEKLLFAFKEPQEPALELAETVPHPWLPEHKLEKIGAVEDHQVWHDLVQANERLKRMLQRNAPASLIERARVELHAKVTEVFAQLLTPDLRISSHICFSGKSTITPASELSYDQIGIPDEFAWTFFGPIVAREVGKDAVEAHTEQAAKALDNIMARSWVLINRAPTLMATAILAFHPVRYPERVIRLHPLACVLMNADFDGDQSAIFLPITEAAQKEAGEKLTIAAHVKRDPSLVKWLRPYNESLWGLAYHSLSEDGKKEISGIVGTEVAAPEGYITAETIIEALKAVMDRDGVEKMLETVEKLMHFGLSITKYSGASINPFIGETFGYPAALESNDLDDWRAYAEEITERLAAKTDFKDPDLGPQLLAVKSGARGTITSLARLIGSQGTTTDASGKEVIIRGSYRDGFTPEELFAKTAGARLGLAKTVKECTEAGYGRRESGPTRAFTVLSRAMRSSNPGAVFARAAATGETDPLVDLDSRLFVGLHPKS